MTHQIRKSFFHKGYVFLLSVVDNQVALWSTHKTDDEESRGTAQYRAMFQTEHDKQVNQLYENWLIEQEKEQIVEALMIDDRTTESMDILNSKN